VDLSERRSGSPQRHPWETSRARFIARLVREHHAADRPVSWLDIGAGDGWLGMQLAATLAPGSTVTCWDAFYTPEDLADLRGAAPDIEFTREQPEDRFDVLSLFDVLEHVADDEGFLSDLLDRNLTAGGHVFVTVPTHPALFSSHDRALHHYRRYRPAECRSLLERCGLIVRSDGGLFATLLAPRAASVLLERLRPTRSDAGEEAGVGAWNGGPTLTRVIGAALAVDNAVARRTSRYSSRYPGLSYWAVCHRS
jgi:2-polyprenyl-3-methyl-5-hydroxy-6-metoxy-1,4-benzoquinol methylase